jgi:serine kinase of HPr protein (carbohydrate metabolism regulator)
MLGGARTVHASAVLVGESAVLIRGPSGAGKSRLALDLLALAEAGRLPFARLVGDDRVALAAAGGRLLASPAPTIAGLIELRGAGILTVPFEPLAVVELVVDLASEDGNRLPEAAAIRTTVLGVDLLRLPISPGAPPLPLVVDLACRRYTPPSGFQWPRLLR